VGTQNIFPLHAQSKASFRAKIVMIEEDTRGSRPRKNKVMLLDEVIQAGRQVYFPCPDFKCPDPERVYVTVPKNIENVREGDTVEFVADVVRRGAEGCSENGNPFSYEETALLRPRGARII
jgi:hypothetical protein